jgi:hypothetical protein
MSTATETTTTGPIATAKIELVLEGLKSNRGTPVTLNQLEETIYKNSGISLSNETIAREVRRLRAEGFTITTTLRGRDTYGIAIYEYTYAAV